MYQQQIELDLAFRVDPEGSIAWTADPSRQLRNRVVSIIGTELGERVMRPGYGTSLQSMLFEGDDEVQLSIIQSDIRRALTTQEPGILVQNVFTTTNEELDGIVNVNVTYSSVNSPFEQVQIPVNTAVLFRGGAIEEERSG